MFALIRSKFGPAVVSIIIGFIAFVFIFFGIYSPRNGGMASGGAAATVGGEVVTIAEFSRAYQQRMQYYESMMKGKADPKLLARLGLRKAVLDDIVRQKALIQESRRQGFVVSDEEVALRIKQLPYFQKDGKFDKATYQQLLQANSQTPGKFEDMIREDISLQKINEFMRGRARVSDEEVRQDFLDNADQRQVEYVMVTPGTDEAARKAAKLTADEIAAKAGTSALKALLKMKKLDARTSEYFSTGTQYIPGIGDVVALKEDAFKAGSPLSKGPAVYENHGMYVVAWNLKVKKSEVSELPQQRKKLMGEILSRKERQLFEDWSKGVMARTKESMNEELLHEPSEDDDRDAPPMAPTAQAPEEL